MDPNANLDELRELVTNLIEHGDRDGTHFLADRRDDVMRVLELFTALDEWLVKGGFLPDRWLNPACDAIVKELPNLTITVTAEERKEARQALVYERALKFVRMLARKSYSEVREHPVSYVDEARAINTDAEQAWT